MNDARQHSPAERNPNGLDMVRVATYERTIRANIERVWENVLDWEHLPHLHATSFDLIELDTAGDWGWRVFSSADRASWIELFVADASNYVSRSYSGRGQTAEIWTRLTARGDATDIRVEFDLPGVPDDKRDMLGERMLTLYGQLWDEDEAMMMARQERLSEARDRARSVSVERDLLPVTIQLGGREYRVTLGEGDAPLVHPTVCPHLLGPLAIGDDASTVACPWHGYRFDLSSGRCVSPSDATCRLPPMPVVVEEGDRLTVSLP